MFSQIYDNAYAMLESTWKNNTYHGFGTVIHKVDHDTSKTDFSLESHYEKTRDLLARSLSNAPSDIVDECRLIMSHFSSSLYKWQFRQCRDGGPNGTCPVCPEPKPARTPVELFYEKFAGDMPSPVPFWAAFPQKPDAVGVPKDPVETLSSLMPNGRSSGAGGAPSLHYRSLLDLLKLNIPTSLLYPDQHYDGPTARHQCPKCSPDVCHRSSAALLRHMRMLH